MSVETVKNAAAEDWQEVITTLLDERATASAKIVECQAEVAEATAAITYIDEQLLYANKQLP